MAGSGHHRNVEYRTRDVGQGTGLQDLRVLAEHVATHDQDGTHLRGKEEKLAHSGAITCGGEALSQMERKRVPYHIGKVWLGRLGRQEAAVVEFLGQG